VPFGVTVDMATVDSKSPLFGTVTLRERDTMKQVRMKVGLPRISMLKGVIIEVFFCIVLQTAEIGDVVARLCDDRITWAEVQAKYPAHE
jgi:hypothetical protein